MAEWILKAKQLLDVEVRSAGIFALEGGEMSENAKMVLNSENIQHAHLSRQVNVDDIEWADVILTMTYAHKEMLIRTFESAAEKTFTLKEYVTPYSAQDVSDPYGGDLSIYKQTFYELQRLIDALQEKMERRL